MTSSSPSSSIPPIEDLDWEEWDSTGGLSFTHHCLAGSFAGVVEHTLLYPLDTVKTCWQSQVLHRSGAGGMAPACDPCGVHQAVTSWRIPATPTAAHHPSPRQSIWSTMTHLMRHGSHHRDSAPNVVDLTAATPSADSRAKQSQRPWSKSSRAIRGATWQDILPSLQPNSYHLHHSSSYHPANAVKHNYSNNSNSSFYNSKTSVTGFKRLWRGVQTMFVGCIPAHALYFSSYEIVKSICLNHNHHCHREEDDRTHCHGSDIASGTHLGTHPPTQQPQQLHHHVGIDTLSPLQASITGGIATLLHDFIMTPLDTMKQRMQLGHYYNLKNAFCSIVWGGDAGGSRVGGGGEVMRSGMTSSSSSSGSSGGNSNVHRMGGEGWRGLYRSFPITVMTNVPYGMIMMTTNEFLRGVLEDAIYGFHEHHHGDERPFHFGTILFSGMGAGMVASAVTAPLDRIKTRLQTQRMGMIIPSYHVGGRMEEGGFIGGKGGAAIMEERALAAARGERKVCPKMAVQDVKSALFPSSSAASAASSSSSSARTISMPASNTFIPAPSAQSPFTKTYYTTPIEAFQSIIQEEGPRGLFRGTLPRVALHAPSVAISWTAYEMAKGWLMLWQ